jgi:hypothetical protein
MNALQREDFVEALAIGRARIGELNPDNEALTLRVLKRAYPFPWGRKTPTTPWVS